MTGNASEAMEDLTGGIVTYIDHSETTVYDLEQKIKQCTKEHGLITGSIESITSGEHKRKDGLIEGHAYSILRTESYRTSANIQDPIIEIMNPHGKTEWKGKYGDNDLTRWTTQRQLAQFKTKINKYRNPNDGRFWMSVRDYHKNFTKTELCFLSAESFLSTRNSVRWKQHSHRYQWKGETAGGCRKFKKTYKNNPKMMFSINLPKSEVIVSLTQMYKRQEKEKAFLNDREMFELISFDIWKTGKMRHDEIDLVECVHKGTFENTRTVTSRLQLDKGSYAIICATFEPGLSGDFLVRLFTTEKIEKTEISRQKSVIRKHVRNPVLRRESSEVEYRISARDKNLRNARRHPTGYQIILKRDNKKLARALSDPDLFSNKFD